MSYHRPTVVGTLTLTEPVQYTDRTFPTASWWRKLELQPGTYDVVARYTWEDLDRERPATLSVALPGVTVDEYFVSTLFTASSVDTPRIGVTHTVVKSAYGYQADRLAAALGLPGATVTWLPGQGPAAAA